MVETAASTATEKVMMMVLHSMGSRELPDVRRLMQMPQ